MSEAGHRDGTSLERTLLLQVLASGQRFTVGTSSTPLVSIIVLVHNRAELTLRCLRALSGCRVPYELVLVDNASTDDTASLLGLFQDATIVRHDRNIGFVRGVNDAAKRAVGTLLLLLNNDTDPLPGAVEAAVSTLRTSSTIGAVVGKLVHLDGRLQEAGSIVWRDGSCQGYGRGGDPMAPEYMFRRDVAFGSGAFLLTPRRTFLDMGGFADAYAPAYYEDADYCARLWQAGLRVVYEPASVVLHVEFASASTSNDALNRQAEKHAVFVERQGEWLRRTRPARGSDFCAARTPRSSAHRVLLIDDRVPHERLGSGYPRSLAMIRALVDLDCHVTMYPLLTPHETWADAYADVPREVELMLGRGNDGLKPFLAERYRFFDTVIVSRPHNMRVVSEALPSARPGRPALIYDAEALFSVRDIGRQSVLGQAPPQVEADRLIANELALVKSSDVVLAVSEVERGRFVDGGIGDVFVLGNALAPAPTASAPSDRRDLLFVGAFVDDTAPNTDSLEWFARDVLPLITQHLGSGVRLDVIGRNESTRLRDLGDAVAMRGMVADVEPYFQAARVFVAPTRFGAGIPTKVQQAAAFGIPVVATSLVANQLAWQDDAELLVADSADRFARQCCALYTDAALWDRIRGAALTAVTRDCSPERFRTTLANAIHRAHSIRRDRTSGVGLHSETTSR